MLPGMPHFTDSETDRFLAGEKIDCLSSWVLAAQWNPADRTLTIFTEHGPSDGYTSPPLEESEAGDFCLAESKGRWLNGRAWWNKQGRR